MTGELLLTCFLVWGCFLLVGFSVKPQLLISPRRTQLDVVYPAGIGIMINQLNPRETKVVLTDGVSRLRDLPELRTMPALPLLQVIC